MGVVGDDVTAVQQAGGHVLAVPGVALDHLVVGLEARHGHFLHGVGLVGSLGSRDDGGVGDQREVDARVRHQVGLELVQIDVQRPVETQGSGDRRDDCSMLARDSTAQQNRARPRRTLSDQTVEVDVVGALEAEVATADVVDGLIVNHEGAVGVLQGGVGGQDGVVWLDDGGGGLGSRVDAELQLALLAVVDGQALHQQGTETRSSATAERVEDQETLETGAAVGDAADLVEDAVDKLLADGVVATGIVVGGILLAGDHVLGVEQASVRAGSDLVDNIGLKIAVDGARDVLPLTCVAQGVRHQINSSTKCSGRGRAYQSRRRRC